MNDNDIIKALECCSYGDEIKCRECPADDCILSCGNKLSKQALDLIDRQKAENEILKDLITYQKQEIKEKEQKYNQAVDDMFGLIETTRNEIAEAKSEAIKEFADRLKEKFSNEDYMLCYYDKDIIDNLVKEIAGVNNE